MRYIISQLGWAFISKLVRSTIGVTETDNLSNAGVGDDTRYIFTIKAEVLFSVSFFLISTRI